MRRVVEFPVVICLMVMSSGATAMTLGAQLAGGVMVFAGLIVGALLVGWSDESRRHGNRRREG